jgi:ribonuclease P protein component
MGLPAEMRVRSHLAFRRAQSHGRKVTTRHFVLLVFARPASAPVEAPNGELSPAQLGLIVSRKVGNAVLRNRIKRCCREAFRQVTCFAPGDLVIVIARVHAETLSPASIGSEWMRAQGAIAAARRAFLRGSAELEGGR